MFNCLKGIFNFSPLPTVTEVKMAQTHLLPKHKFIRCWPCKNQYVPGQRDEFTVDIRTILSPLHPHKMIVLCLRGPGGSCTAQLGNRHPINVSLDQREAQLSITWPCRAFCVAFRDLEKEPEVTDWHWCKNANRLANIQSSYSSYYCTKWSTKVCP